VVCAPIRRFRAIAGDWAASAVLADEATKQAEALRQAWSAVWHGLDTLGALRGAWLPVRPEIRPDAIRLIQMLGALDHRQFPAGRNAPLARAGQRWKDWHAALSKDASAEAPDFRDDGASVANVYRVA
jgi:hypothetical protein